MSKALIPIVNEQDEIIGYKMSKDVGKGEIYRVSALWIKNSRGDILLAQRGLREPHDPGIWGPAAAGTVEKGESYLANITKEAEEELGLKGMALAAGPKRRNSGRYDYFTQWYIATVDKPAEDFRIQEDELEQVRWFTREELARELQEHPDQYFSMVWALEEL